MAESGVFLPTNIPVKDVYAYVRIKYEDYLELIKMIERYDKQKENQRKKYREKIGTSSEFSTKKPKITPRLELLKLSHMNEQFV